MAEKRAPKECKTGASGQAKNSKKNRYLGKSGILARGLHCIGHREAKNKLRAQAPSAPKAREQNPPSVGGTHRSIGEIVPIGGLPSGGIA